jgi:hypothetical protein
LKLSHLVHTHQTAETLWLVRVLKGRLATLTSPIRKMELDDESLLLACAHGSAPKSFLTVLAIR